MGSTDRPAKGGTPYCPPWCTLRHGLLAGEEDNIHVGGALRVKDTLLRLAVTIDPDTGEVDGPYVYYGAEDLTLHEAEALIGALTQLVEEAEAGVTASAAGRRRSSGP